MKNQPDFTHRPFLKTAGLSASALCLQSAPLFAVTARKPGDKRFVGEGNHPLANDVPKSIPRVAGHLDEWADACLGGPRVFSDFDFGGHLTEIGLAGIVALRLGKSIDWDGDAMKAPGMPEADRFIRPA